MKGRSADWLMAFAGGLLLAVMINQNNLLARHTTPFFASWVAHGVGAGVALLLLGLSSRGAKPARKPDAPAARPRLWFYLGGVPGALTVVLVAIAVNSRLSLSCAIALMLLGQVLFGIASDSLGLFGIAKRRLAAADFVVALSVLAGSALIIFGGA